MKYLFRNFSLAIALLYSPNLFAKDPAPSPVTPWDNLSSSNVPTVITSDSMNLNTKNNRFTYTGNVVLDKGDFHMTSKRLEGKYNEEQGIDELEAHENVEITKGANVKAHSNKAVYDKNTETMILTDNPEVNQNESILTADIVHIFLHQNRSTAEGNVRVKLVENNEPK